MPGEKHPDLRQKLAALSEVPDGFSFKKEEAWQRMAPALPVARRRAGFYWVAAASVLLLLAGGWALWWPASQPIAPTSAVGTNEEKPVRFTEVHQTKTIAAKRQSPRTSKQPLKQKAPPVVAVQSLLIEPPVQNSAPVILPLPAADTIRTAVVVKPKFKVAHINELTLPAEAPPPAKEPLALGRLSQGTADGFASVRSTRNTETRNKPMLKTSNQQHE